MYPMSHEMLVLFAATFIDVSVYPQLQEMYVSFARLFDRCQCVSAATCYIIVT